MERTEALSLLDLGNAATRDEIMRRALKLLNEFHPDKHAEATGNATLKKLLEEKFNKVREARDYLLNGDAFDAGTFPPNAAKPSPPVDEVAKACGSIGISHVEFAGAVSRLRGLFYRAELAEGVVQELFPGLIHVLKRSEVVGPIIIRTKLELLKTLEGNPALQNVALKILEGDDVAPALMDLPFAGIAVAYSVLGNPWEARISNHAEVLASAWAAALSKEEALDALGENIMLAMRAPLSSITNVMQEGAATLGVILREEPWNTLLGAFVRRLVSLSFWTALKLLPEGSNHQNTHESAKVPGDPLRRVREHVSREDWHQAWHALEEAKGVASQDTEEYARLRNLIRKNIEDNEAAGKVDSNAGAAGRDRSGRCRNCGGRYFTSDGRCLNCEVGTAQSSASPDSPVATVGKPDFFDVAAEAARQAWAGIKKKGNEIKKDWEQTAAREAAEEAARKKEEADSAPSSRTIVIVLLCVFVGIPGMGMLLASQCGHQRESPSSSGNSSNVPFDANQPSSASPAPVVDAWKLYRKVGRRWHWRTTIQNLRENYQTDTFIEILEVHADEAVVRRLIIKAEKVEGDDKGTVKFREGWAPNIPYLQYPEVEYLIGREDRRTEAGLFNCNAYHVPTHAGTYWTYVWASRDFNGLLVEAEVHAPAGLVEHVVLIAFFDPPSSLALEKWRAYLSEHWGLRVPNRDKIR